jgi:hypothetical protein
MPNPKIKIPVYKKSQLLGELEYLFGNTIKKSQVLTQRKRGEGSVVTFMVQDKVYSKKALTPGKAYLGLLMDLRKDVSRGVIKTIGVTF